MDTKQFPDATQLGDKQYYMLRRWQVNEERQTATPVWAVVEAIYRQACTERSRSDDHPHSQPWLDHFTVIEKEVLGDAGY